MAEAKVSGEIRSGQLILSLGAAKGSPEEADALRAMEYLVLKVADANLPHQIFKRNTAEGDRIDQIRIYL